jgi:antitoxin component of MazEF toxin-antitoxin module
LIGADVEARSINGSVTRGRLLEVGDGFLIVEKSTTRRRTYVSLAHLVALVDETAPALTHRERAELAGEGEGGGE